MIRLLFLTVVYICSFNVSVAAAPNILILGDSISAEFGLDQNQGWVNLLQQRLATEGYPHKVVNSSISGETSGGGLRRIQQTLDRHNPAIVVIELGANDGLRGLKLTQLENNLSRITELSLNQQAKVIILGMQLPPNYGPSYTEGFSKVFLNVSNHKKVLLVPFLFHGFASNLQYFQDDRIHPNAQAQPLILNNVWPVLHPLLTTN